MKRINSLLFILYCSYRALLTMNSHNIQSNKMHSIGFRYSVLQYLVNPTCFELRFLNIFFTFMNFKLVIHVYI
jgi:hypothetical protein